MIIKSDDTAPNHTGNPLEHLIYNNQFKKEFLSKRKVFMWGPVEDESAKEVVDQLLYLEFVKPGQEITLFINSPGGVVTSGMVVYDCMQMISSPVSTVCMGLAASMGALLLSGGEKGRRFIWPSGRVMIHQPSIGRFFGQASDLQIQAREMARTKEVGAKILAKNCNKTVDQIMKDFDRDYWMNSDESVKYGIVDGLVNKLDLKA
jgi:ATP-dependent Clp protease, protease subunit